jgi:pimeloyl-ACP methyl ester carboxylesterase
VVPAVTTWVLLRGLMREARHWGEFPAQFQAVTGATRLVTVDFPGNGSLHAQSSACSVEAMAKHCHDQLRRLGHTPPYSVLAMSLGAMVAVEWSKQYPGEIERLVLINTSLAPQNPFHHRLRSANYPALLRSMIFGGKTQREQIILRVTSNIAWSTDRKIQLLAQWVGYAQDAPVSRMNILRQLYAAASYRATSTPPGAPVLLLAGLNDRLVAAQCSRTLARLWSCKVEMHETAGHDLPLDDGLWVAERVREWLASDASQAPDPDCGY